MFDLIVRWAEFAKAEIGAISRQAVYLHFPSRTDLLIETTKYTGDLLNVEERLAPSRAAATGLTRLRLYIEFWGNYIPRIYAVARALLVAQETDEAVPHWVPVDAVPYDRMWEDDRYWIPLLLAGRRFEARALFEVALAIEQCHGNKGQT